MNIMIKVYTSVRAFFGDFWFYVGKLAGRVMRWLDDVITDVSDGYAETRFAPVLPDPALGSALADLLKTGGRVPDGSQSAVNGSKAPAESVDTTGR
jgi:hypothetical protein